MANPNIARAVRVALVTAAAVSAGLSGVTAAAQESLDEIVVTGSRIARPELDSASPVTVISAEALQAAGVTDVGDLIQSIPSMSGSPIGTTTNNGGNGGVFIDLRGMGTDRTLTLVNGMRTVDGGDYQTIPANIIERVEVLKDGASAVYGADAVAGVVNIITRNNYDGLEISAQAADYFDMDAGMQASVSLFGGKTFDSGHFVFGLEYVDQEAAYQSDAPWDYFQNSYYIYPEGCEKQVAKPYDGTPQGGCYPLGSSRIPEGRLRFASQGTFMNEDGSGLVPYDGRTYNYAPVNYIQTPYERTNLFLDGKFALTDTVDFRASMRGNFRQSAQELAPQPYNSPTDPAYAGIWNGAAYTGISEQNYYLRQAIDAYNLANPTAPLAYQPVTDARRRMVEIPRRFTQDITQIQTMMGLSGTVLGDLKWDAYYNFGYRSRIDHDFGQFSGAELGNAMGPSADLDGNGVPECYGDINDPSSLISGCVPFNFFGGPFSVTQDMLDYVGANLTDTTLTKQHEASASISGSLMDLPGGPLGWAVGYSFLKYSLDNSPDSMKQKGTVTGNKGAGTEGSLTANSVFAEVLAPVFDNGSQALDLKGGVRYDDYDAFDSEVTGQIGVEFQVIRDLKLRATYGLVFRAPTIYDLYGGTVDDFPQYTDPCVPAAGQPLPAGCAQVGVQTDSQVLARVGGNPNLKPETGDTLTAGVVWTPQLFGGDFSATVDYWQVAIEDGISSLGVQFILDDCYINQNAASCALVTRRADYSVAQVIDGSLNVADQGAKGVDTELAYTWDTGVGNFRASLLWSHLLERTKTPFKGADEIDLSGRYTDPTAQDGGAYATDKINYSLTWRWNDLMVAYQGEYISSLDADTFCNCGDGNRPDGSYIQSIGSQLYHDIVASYDFGQGTSIAGGLTNITDEEPPFIEVGFNATTDPSTYRMFGRGYYLRLTHSFE